MNQKELYEALKNNPLNLPVYFAQDRIKKEGDFIVFVRTGNTATYTDNSIYAIYNNIQVMIYCKDIDNLNKMIIWCQKLLNVPAEINHEDLYYTANFLKEIYIKDWNISDEF